MIIGDPTQFGIQIDVYARLESVVHIRFLLIVGNQVIGNEIDSIDLITSVKYTKDFLTLARSRDRFDMRQYDAASIFHELYDSVILVTEPGELASDYIHECSILNVIDTNDYREIFHFDDIGGSSLTTRYGIIVVNTTEGEQRIIWQSFIDMAIHEHIVTASTVEMVLHEYINYAQSLLVQV